MDHGDLAQIGAVLGALGSMVVLLWSARVLLFAGFAVLAAAELMLAYALVPGSDLDALVSSPARAGAVALLVVGVVLLAAAFVRFPAVTPVVLLVAAPFRVPVTLGRQEAFLLVPLYVVIAAAVLALLVRSLRREPLASIPWEVGIPSAAFIGLSGLSLWWSGDLRAGTIHLLFFLFPFAALLAVVARAPFAEWLPKALGVTFPHAEDKEGKFRIEGLVPGLKYNLGVMKAGAIVGYVFKDAKFEAGETRDLGNVQAGD